MIYTYFFIFQKWTMSKILEKPSVYLSLMSQFSSFSAWPCSVTAHCSWLKNSCLQARNSCWLSSLSHHGCKKNVCNRSNCCITHHVWYKQWCQFIYKILIIPKNKTKSDPAWVSLKKHIFFLQRDIIKTRHLYFTFSVKPYHIVLCEITQHLLGRILCSKISWVLSRSCLLN